MPPKATVIVSVYNRLDFLKLVLAGLEGQTEPAFEVIVSDDGSGEAFVSGLKEEIAATPLRLRHVWHEDTGFRKNKILNEAIRTAGAPYLIFLDGDCIPHPRFVEEHLAHAAANTCLAGRRIDLSARLTQKLTPDTVRNGMLQRFNTWTGLLLDFLTARAFHFMNGMYVRNPLLRRYFNRKERGLLGANFSVGKAEMERINGFDERYNAPTFGEDSDVELRLRLSGVRIVPVLNIAVAYHCHHKLLPRPDSSRLLYEQAVREARLFTPFGLKQ